MARIRTIKPEFFTSLDVANLSMAARLLYIGLWTNADDAGRQRAEPRLLKAAIFPLDDEITSVKVAGLLAELETNGQIVLYDADTGERLYQVVAWEEHQRIDRPKPSKWTPRPVADASSTDQRQVDDASPLEGKGKEGTGQTERDGSLVDRALDAYTMSVCLANKNTNRKFRDSVRSNATDERAPILRAFLAEHFDADLDDLLELLGLPRVHPKSGRPPGPVHDPNCEHCAGSGWRTIDTDRNIVGPCDCNAIDATVHEFPTERRTA